MIYYTIFASIGAVALWLTLDASRAQVRGLAKELNKKTNLCYKYETQLLDYRAEVLGEKDKAKTWEERGLVAERDLRAALDRLFALEERNARIREQDRIRKQRSRAKKKAAKNEQ